MNARFPHLTYGTKKNSETYKKSFPMTFKRYFFKLLKSLVRTEGGLKTRDNAPPAFMLPGGKRCTMHDFQCPEECAYATLNKKVTLRQNVYRRRKRDPATFRSRVWRRKDFKKALKDVFMTNNELENCLYEPAANSMNQNIELALTANKGLNRNEFFVEGDPEAYFEKLGKNFESSHPEVYKQGILKRA